MDTFEAARLKHAKNLGRRTRSMDVVEVQSAPVSESLVSAVVPKEKTDAVIEVNVSLPMGDFSFVLKKRQVLQNVAKSRLTRQEFLNCLIKGLGPLLGEVKE
jgi:hypothetical protein